MIFDLAENILKKPKKYGKIGEKQHKVYIQNNSNSQLA